MALINPATPSRRPGRPKNSFGGGGGGAPGGLVATAPAGGGGGGGNPHLNNMRQQQRQQQRQRRNNRGGGGGGVVDPTTPPPADDGNTITNTGPGTNNFNSTEFGVQGGLGLLAGQGIAPTGTAQSAWLNDAMTREFANYTAGRTSNPALVDQTWTQYLANKFGGTPAQAAPGGPPAPPAVTGNEPPVHKMGGKQRNRNKGKGKGKTPDDPAAPDPVGDPAAAGDPVQMANYFRNQWYRGNPEERGYFGANIAGPGRVIPG